MLKIKLKALVGYFSIFEIVLWIASVLLILISFFVFTGNEYLALAASLIGVTSLIFNAKGNPFGQFLMIIFSVLYGIISLTFSYYGEMITYLGMIAPMAVFSLISWLRNPYSKTKSEVRVNVLKAREIVLMSILTIAMTASFYFILEFFNTTNIVPSTVSVATSFLAVYLTFRRSAFYALAYAANDVVLIVLWVLASLTDVSYLSVVICFAVFLINDIYGFFEWRKMLKRQNSNIVADECKSD